MMITPKMLQTTDLRNLLTKSKPNRRYVKECQDV
ncbi:Uncharacterised protein [uncultured Clostridium sp.]|nr:Uncharacterised protein [uncultured Clostridium sp.]SCJ15490.1 Uncharacterised protein [uncultured Clostridium sp.]